MNPLRNISIRTKVVLIVAGTLTIANFVAVLLVRDLVYRFVVSQKIETVEILAASFVHDVKYNLDVYQEGAAQDIIAKYMTYYRNIRDITFYDPSLHAVAASRLEHLGRLPDDPRLEDAVRNARPSTRVLRSEQGVLWIRSISPIMKGSRVVGAAAIDISILDIDQALAALDRSILLLQGVKTLVVCVALYILIRGAILRRLMRLTEATHRIAKGDYDISLPVKPLDEISELAAALNQMSADLKRSRNELDRYNRELEGMVDRKTAALTKTYEDLKSAQSALVLSEKMASLGVLIAGVAHEINTPVGAILNVARNLSRTLSSMPDRLLPFWDGLRVPAKAMAECLGRVRDINEKPGDVSSHRDAKRIEAYLEAEGVPEARQRSVILTRLGFTDPESVARHLHCFRDPDFLKLAETYGSVAQSVAIAETSSQKISDIVRALKYYARSDTDRMGPISVNESIQVALVLLRNHLKNRVTVATDLASDLPAVLGTGELNQIWTNLLSNACDAVDEAGEEREGRIVVRTWREGNRVVATVTDNGIGIPAEKLEKVFDPFYTTKDIGKGTGLGLSIVSGIVKKLGGSVEVSSRPGETCFRVALPAMEGAQSRAA